jgi:hypothetical protein
MSSAEDFLGAPVMHGGKLLSQSEDRLEKTYDTSFENTVKFYRDALKAEKDIKYLDRGAQLYIEEHSNRPWHSVTITKVTEDRTDVVVLKDNWTWILGTLTLRFFGVFAVLIVLYIALAISGAIMSRVFKTQQAY